LMSRATGDSALRCRCRDCWCRSIRPLCRPYAGGIRGCDWNTPSGSSSTLDVRGLRPRLGQKLGETVDGPIGDVGRGQQFALRADFRRLCASQQRQGRRRCRIRPLFQDAAGLRVAISRCSVSLPRSRPVSEFKGKGVVVSGAGQNALESAPLPHEREANLKLSR